MIIPISANKANYYHQKYMLIYTHALRIVAINSAYLTQLNSNNISPIQINYY